MKKLIEKFLNEDFIVLHEYHEGLHTVTSYRRDTKKIISQYITSDERYAHLRFMQSVCNFIQ